MIHVINRSKLDIPAPRLVAAAQAALAAEGSGHLDLSISVVTDAEIHLLNRSYLKHDYPTDVISFPLRDGNDPDVLLGEVIVSSDHARHEARQRGLSFEEELCRYVVHGTLHLLGYDDREADKREHMHKRQEAILDKLLGTRRRPSPPPPPPRPTDEDLLPAKKPTVRKTPEKRTTEKTPSQPAAAAGKPAMPVAGKAPVATPEKQAAKSAKPAPAPIPEKPSKSAMPAKSGAPPAAPTAKPPARPLPEVRKQPVAAKMHPSSASRRDHGRASAPAKVAPAKPPVRASAPARPVARKPVRPTPAHRGTKTKSTGTARKQATRKQIARKPAVKSIVRMAKKAATPSRKPIRAGKASGGKRRR